MMWPFGKSNFDPGWQALEQCKKMWKTLPLEFHNGKVYQPASAFQDHPQVQKAITLFQKSIELASNSNLSFIQSQVNKALAHQELGLLYRVVNEFGKAKTSYQASNEVLETAGGITSREKAVLTACRETLFRIAELNHVMGDKIEAIAGYKASLGVDALLGHDDPVGELMTQRLIDSLK